MLRSRPRGPNRLSSHEERVFTSYNLGTKINGLHHCGIGTMFYNGLRGPDIARSWGTTELDTPGWGPPFCTRGLLIDVLGYLIDTGRSEHLSEAPDGRPLLRDDYRITLEDLRAAADHQALPPFEPGDALLIRTGWRHLIRTDPERYLRYCPGPFLRECRWLATFRPAVVGNDTWAFETIDPAVRGDNLSPCHQELFLRCGIRIAESLQLEDLAGAGVDRFVFCHTPLLAEGATSSNAPPLAIANATGSPRPGDRAMLRGMLERRFLAPHAIARWASATPDAVALEQVGGERITYRRLLDDTLRWAAAYRRLGVGAGDHVATMIPHGLAVPKAWIGLGWLRAVEVPLNTAYIGSLLRYALDMADVTTMVIGVEYFDRLMAVADSLPLLAAVVVVGGPAPDVDTPFRLLSEDEFLAGIDPATDILDSGGGPDYRDPAAILFTSGTTGPSKAVLCAWALIFQMWSWVPDDALARRRGAVLRLPDVPQLGEIDVQLLHGSRRPLRAPGSVQRRQLLGRRAGHQLRSRHHRWADDRPAPRPAAEGPTTPTTRCAPSCSAP